MLRELQDFLGTLRFAHGQMAAILDELPQEALDWAPGEGMNSIAVLAAHSAFGEHRWIGHIVGGDDLTEERGEGFAIQGADAAALKTRLDASLAQVERVFERLSREDLEATRYRTPWEENVSAMGPISHALEHTTTHLGHVEMTKQLWEAR